MPTKALGCAKGPWRATPAVPVHAVPSPVAQRQPVATVEPPAPAVEVQATRTGTGPRLLAALAEPAPPIHFGVRSGHGRPCS